MIAGVAESVQHPQMPTVDVVSTATRVLIPSQASQGLTSPPATSAWGRRSMAIHEAAPGMISSELPLDELKRSLSESQDPALRSATLDAIAGR